LKRRDAIRALVIVCVILAALGILVPGKAPALNPMQGPVTTTVTITSTFPPSGSTSVIVFSFTFSNIITSTWYTSYIATTTSTEQSITYYPVTATMSTTSWTTVSTRTSTKNLGTTTVPSTSTTLTMETATTTGQTIATTASQTMTSTHYTTTSNTSTSMFTVTGAPTPTPPPIPGFPLESILAGLGLGLLCVHLIYRNRRVERGHS
jgi:hypothetical protein